jgi:hypothetical protein
VQPNGGEYAEIEYAALPVEPVVFAVKVAHVIYQKIIAAYADPNRRRGKRALAAVIESPTRRHPGVLRSPRLQRAHRSH